MWHSVISVYPSVLVTCPKPTPCTTFSLLRSGHPTFDGCSRSTGFCSLFWLLNSWLSTVPINIILSQLMQRCWIFDTALFPKMLKNNINLLFVFMTSVCLFMSGLFLLQSLGSCMLLMKWKCYIMNVEVDHLQSLNTVQTWDVLTYPHNKAHMCDSSLSKGKRHSILLCALKLLSDSVLQRCPYVCFLF